MNNKIKDNIEDPEKLESLYRSDKKEFEKAFNAIYHEIAKYPLAEFWKIRLERDSTGTRPFDFQRRDIWRLIISCIVAALLIKLPQVLGIEMKDFIYYVKNGGLIVLFGLSLYSLLTKQTIKFREIAISLSLFIISALYINLLPYDQQSDSVNLAYIHLPLMIWFLYGIIFIDFNLNDTLKRMDYIRYNGDLAIWGGIIIIAGGILTGITLGLFSAIDINIEDFYFNYIVVCGIVAVPIVATFIIKNHSLVTNKIAPVIANIFSPLVLITLIIYLTSIVVTGKDPYNDRDFLLVFNLMLLGVMAIIVFSISETSNRPKHRFNEWILFMLSVVTLIVDLVALSAILYRVGEFGFTPNRTAVLGSNLLIFGNLVLIMVDLYKVNVKHEEISRVEMSIARYLPVYMIWTIFVVFVLPFIFGMK